MGYNEDGFLTMQEYLEGVKVGYNIIKRQEGYTDEYKAKNKFKAIHELRQKQRNIIESQIEDIQIKQDQLIKKYTPKKLDDLAYMRKRTEINDRLQLMEDDELEKLLENTTPEADPLEVDLAILEVKNRGNASRARDWKIITEQYNLKEPHKNDPLWKDLEKQTNSLKTQLANDDFLYLDNWENDQRQIKPIEQALEGE